MATDSFVNFADEVRQEVNKNYSKTPVQYPNQKDFDKPENEAWVKMVINDGETLAIDIASNPTFRSSGILVFGIFVPTEQGDRELRDIADELGSLFRYKQIDKTLFRAPSLDVLGRVQIDNGAWYQGDVTIPFRRDTNHKIHD